jgi:hypothetical protein
MTESLDMRHKRSHLVPRGNMLFMSTTPRTQQQQFAFRLNEHTAKVFRDKLAKDVMRQQDVLEILAAAWADGRLDVRQLREDLADSKLI